MELIELLNQTPSDLDDRLGTGVKCFLFNRAFLPGSPKLRLIMATALVSISYRGF
jgi:hypothetical protein